MKKAARAGRAVAAMLVLAVSARAADETITVNLMAGDNDTVVANRIAMAWSQIGAFDCFVQGGNILFIVDKSGDCDEKISRFVITVAGGTLSQNHTLMFRMRCDSPVEASVDLDGLGFVILVVGSNSVTSGADTLGFALSHPSAVPALPGGAPVLLGSLVVLAGVLFLGRKRATT